MNQSLLQGKIQPQLLRLALPLFLGSLLQQLYNAADALIVGKLLGTAAFASTGVSGTVMNIFIFVLNGFCVGASILFGQEFGAGKKEEFRKSVFTVLTAGAVITAAFSLLSLSLLRPLLRLIQTPEELTGYCVAYLRFILGGLMFTFLYNLFASVLRSMGDTRAALAFLAVSACLNIVLDIALIRAFHSTGAAAAATVLSQGVSAVCSFVYLRKKYPEYLFSRRDCGFYPELLSRAMRLGLVSALHQSSLYIGKLLVQGAVNSLGTSVIAAFTAAARVEGLLGSFGESGGQAISIHISQNVGAGNRPRVREALRKGMGLNHLLCTVMVPLTFLFAPQVVNLFLGGADPTALDEGVRYLRIIGCFYLLGFSGNAFVGYFRGTGHVMIPFIATTAQLTCRVILSYLLTSRLGLSAVAWATGIGWILIICIHFSAYTFTRRRDDAAFSASA